MPYTKIWIVDAARQLEAIQNIGYGLPTPDLDRAEVFANHWYESRYLKLADALSKFNSRQSDISGVVGQMVNPDATSKTLYAAFRQWLDSVWTAERLAKNCATYYDDLFKMFNLLPYPIWVPESHKDPERVIFQIFIFMRKYLAIERKNFQMITTLNDVVDVDMKRAYSMRLGDINETMRIWMVNQPPAMADTMNNLLIAIQYLPAEGVLTLGMTSVFDFLLRAKNEQITENGIVALTYAVESGMTDVLVDRAWVARWDDKPYVNPPYKYRRK